MSYSIEIVGLEALAQRFKNAPGVFETLLGEAAVEAIESIRIPLATYPPPRGYERTGTLASGWHDADPILAVSGFEFEASITNYTHYGPFVQGPGDQAPIHQGYWDTTQDVLDDQEADMVLVFGGVLVSLADMLGGA